MKLVSVNILNFKQDDLLNFNIIDYQRLSTSERELLNDLKLSLKNTKFKSIKRQFEEAKPQGPRRRLDQTWLEILGFSKEQIERWIPELYSIVSEEIIAIRELRD